jgi:hypothetical protein
MAISEMKASMKGGVMKMIIGNGEAIMSSAKCGNRKQHHQQLSISQHQRRM